MRYLIFIVCLFFGCKGLDSSRSLIHNVGFAQGTSYSIKYMSSEDYHHEIDSLLTVIDNSLSTYNTNSLLSQLNSGDTSLLLDTILYVFLKPLSIFLYSAMDYLIVLLHH